eukprot:TRINITY_DN1406_c0_g1_i3.p1 TRINITY_DN1406_c0_g1~~TRINITY_DN1406_c0_g1_i3.p1  ORF type:complete len:373 (+),score=16.27 TRINITY_DN1406_c0_g1_i3:55-1119(+)
MFVSCAACRPRKCVNPVDFWKVRRFSFAVNLPISYVFKQVSKKRRAQRTKFIVTSLVNVDVFSPSVVLGGVMVGAGCYLYMVRQQKPEISKDLDVIAATMMTVTGGIVFLQGWRLDPLLLLSQLMLAVMVFYFANDALTLRKNFQNSQQDIINFDPRSMKRKVLQSEYDNGYWSNSNRSLPISTQLHNLQGVTQGEDQLYQGDMEYYDNSWAEFDYYLQRGVEGENQYEVYNRLTPQPIQDGPFQSSNSQECTVNAGQYDSLNYSQDDLLMQGNSSVVSSDLQDRAANNDYQYQYFNSTNIPSAKFIDINANTTSQDSRQDGQQPQKLNQNVHDNFYYFDQQRVSNNEVLGENF